jgi:2TM domain
MQEGPLPNPPVEEALRIQAEKRVKDKIELLTHLAVYAVINGFLVVIWALSGRGYPWFLWVMAGWGIGLVLHITGYFIGSKSEGAKERMVRKEMERIKKEQGNEPS